MRLALLSVLISGCVCTPLTEVCGGGKAPCPTESQFVSDALLTVRQRWMLLGECTRGKVGSSSQGTWVSLAALDFCDDTFHFNRAGELIAKSQCCNKTCTYWGFGTRIERGAVTRDLCAEAAAQLFHRPVLRVKTIEVDRLRASDGGTPDNFSDIWWLLSAGSYTAELSDGGRDTVDVVLSGDGGLELSPQVPWLMQLRINPPAGAGTGG